MPFTARWLLRYLGLSFEMALSTIIFGCGFDLNEITMVNGALARGSFDGIGAWRAR
ncbi:hypothetical protein ES288_A07G082900v1 [Gossypium darwinii]|uniref:Uncharacterized protein n=1 Tax=Gossypium darwinii TaxID=34276 RepID=A0A5D2FVF3_GOSDA|nr:hypothetical protein ES288_A07G082900v1 [Gossypium darwinii]